MDTVPTQPTMSLHEIAAKLWVTDKEAYWNLKFYIAEHDRISESLRTLIVEQLSH